MRKRASMGAVALGAAAALAALLAGPGSGQAQDATSKAFGVFITGVVEPAQPQVESTGGTRRSDSLAELPDNPLLDLAVARVTAANGTASATLADVRVLPGPDLPDELEKVLADIADGLQAVCAPQEEPDPEPQSAAGAGQDAAAEETASPATTDPQQPAPPPAIGTQVPEDEPSESAPATATEEPERSEPTVTSQDAATEEEPDLSDVLGRQLAQQLDAGKLCEDLQNGLPTPVSLQALDVRCDGKALGFDLVNLAVFGQTIDLPDTVEPNTTVPLGPLGSLTLNKQSSKQGEASVQGVVLSIAEQAEIVLASATCGQPMQDAPTPPVVTTGLPVTG